MMFVGSKPLSSISNNNNIEVPEDGLALAIHESNMDWIQFQADQEIAVSNMYEHWIMDRGHTDEQKQAVYEGVISDIFEKIKKFFKFIAEKIKKWFQAVLKYFKTAFMSDKDFITKYKEELEGKEDEKFQFSAHKWDFDGVGKKMFEIAKTTKNYISGLHKTITKWDAWKALGDTITKEKEGEPEVATASLKRIETYVNGIIMENSNDLASKMNAAVKAEKKKVAGQFLAAVRGAEGVGNIGQLAEGSGSESKFKEAFGKSLRGGEKKSCKGFGSGKSLSLSSMIEYVENQDDKLSEIKDLASEISDTASECSDNVDTIVADWKSKNSTATSSDESDVRKVVKGYSEICRTYLNYSQYTCQVYESELKDCIRECSSILREFARYNAETKESYRPRRNTSSSLIENWYNF